MKYNNNALDRNHEMKWTEFNIKTVLLYSYSTAATVYCLELVRLTCPAVSSVRD